MKLSNKIAIIGNSFVIGGVVAACSFFINDNDVLAQQSGKQITCLADNIYFESNNQSQVGQIAVANVTLNRVNSTHFPNTVCDVVWEHKQFSWTHDNKSDMPGDAVMYNSIYNLAELVYNGIIPDITEGSTFYHADYVDPYWATSMDEKVTTIDNHIFYKHKGR
tara:strand:+ start:3643 stop:4134 length:492 start_codon:yes stop_codon:yes gene_type:complete